jgi:DNA helicase-2/ATP-dependent DNA helicase PcrA
MKPVSQVTRTSVSSATSNLPHAGETGGGLAVGDTVQHDRFGTGRIVKFEGAADSLKATVEFQNAGVKQLLLKYARLKKIT